jgi:transposase InsO family protein
VSRFRFVSDHRGAYGVKRLCRILEVSRSGFYAWASRPPSDRTVRDTELTELITQVHERSRRTYGSPRIHAELRRLDQRCSRKRIARLMRISGLVGVHARRRWRRGRPDVAPAPDLVNRRFDPVGVDRVWAADVTQFRTGEGWLYLAGVIDLYSRRIVGWSMSARPDTDLVTDALIMAFQRRRPDRRVVHHSDRGAIYTSLAFGHRLADYGLAQSFGSTGDCYDNAAVEAFWATLKRELSWIHQRSTWATRDQLRGALFDYIEAFYNPERIQRRLDHHSPTNYEKLTTVA